MLQQLWGVRVEKEIYLGVRERKGVNITFLEVMEVSFCFGFMRSRRRATFNCTLQIFALLGCYTA